MKSLVDTCVILDALQKREPFWQDAEELFRAAAVKKVIACITAKSASDIYYLTHKVTHSDTESRRLLGKLFSIFSLLDSAGVDCQKALLSRVADYEDAIMIETAMREGMDCIITRNLRDYSFSPLPVYTPREFLKRIDSTDR